MHLNWFGKLFHYLGALHLLGLGLMNKSFLQKSVILSTIAWFETKPETKFVCPRGRFMSKRIIIKVPLWISDQNICETMEEFCSGKSPTATSGSRYRSRADVLQAPSED